LERPRDELGARRGGAHHVVPFFLEQEAQPLAQQRGVVGDQDAHGITASTRVPEPAGERTSRCPSSEATRPARPASPPPVRIAAPPRPSSSILTRTSSPIRVTSTVADSAPECFAAFVSASETT